MPLSFTRSSTHSGLWFLRSVLNNQVRRQRSLSGFHGIPLDDDSCFNPVNSQNYIQCTTTSSMSTHLERAQDIFRPSLPFCVFFHTSNTGFFLPKSDRAPTDVFPFSVCRPIPGGGSLHVFLGVSKNSVIADICCSLRLGRSINSTA